MVTLLIGTIFKNVFTGIGMVMLPYDLINEFVYRPKLIDRKSWQSRRKVLMIVLLKLREEGKRLEKAKSQVDLMRGLSGYTRRYTFSKEMTVWMTQTLLAEKEFKKLEDQADFNNRVEPCYYIWKLVQGIMALIYASLIMFLILSSLFKRAGIGKSTLNPFTAINNYILELGQGDARLVIFWIVGTIFVLFCIFILVIAETGNEKLGFNFALLTYYAKAPNET